MLPKRESSGREKSDTATNCRKRMRAREIRIVNNYKECIEVSKTLRSHCEEYNVLGFNCQWAPFGYRKVSLLQLSSHRGLCALIRLCKLNTIPTDLQTLLEDVKVLKVGIQPQDNYNKLLGDYDVRVSTILDIRQLAKKCNPLHFEMGLAKLTKEYLGEEIFKNHHVQRHWEMNTLTEENVKYAANDVQASIELFKRFQEILTPKDEFNDPATHLKRFIDEHCRRYLDANIMSKSDVNYTKRLALCKCYEITKPMHCMVCGHVRKISRERVIPNKYRKHLSPSMYHRANNDFLFLCSECRQKNYALDLELAERLTEQSKSFETNEDITPEEKVIRYFGSTEYGLLVFEWLWREHFVINMLPKTLPKLWSKDIAGCEYCHF